MVGCVPNSVDFKHPADRRRYLYYLKKRAISYELAQFDHYYDVLYVSISADLGKWSAYKASQLQKGNATKVIFDLSDLYLTDHFLKDILRGIFHSLSGKNSKFTFSFKQALMNMMSNTDILICTSEEQKKILDAYHNNVKVARDFFGEDIKEIKSNYNLSVEGELNVFWEGFSHGNIEIFKKLRLILDRIADVQVRLHIMTDSEYCKIGTSFLCRPTYAILKEVFSESAVKFHLYDWNAVTFSSIAINCDMAIVPIPDNPVMMRKPENKLILLWSMGIPVIASETPSYLRVMNAIEQDFLCNSLEEWEEKISKLYKSKEVRETYIKNANKYLQMNASSEIVLSIWDTIFN